MITSVDPLRIYLYDDGLAWFATENYKKPKTQNRKNMYMHLTNYSINKNSSKFQSGKTQDDESVGHKRSWTSVIEILRTQGHDTDLLQWDIKKCIIKTILCA